MHPSNDQARIISLYKTGVKVSIGEKSDRGRGGMQAKIDAAVWAINSGVPAAVRNKLFYKLILIFYFQIIASGYIPGTITRILNGENVGTLFLSPSNSQQEDGIIML